MCKVRLGLHAGRYLVVLAALVLLPFFPSATRTGVVCADGVPYTLVLKTNEGLKRLSIPTGAPSLDAVLSLYGIQELVPLFDIAAGDSALKRALGLSRIYRVTVSPSVDQAEVLAALSSNPAVEYVEQDGIGYGAGLPNDQWFAYQWNLHNTGQQGGEPDADVDAPEAWEISQGLTTTVLAVIDTGVDLDHPDLAGKTISGYDFVNGDADPQDDHGHGTHVAGIMAALTDNGVGVAGLCPHCRIMPLKALNSENWGYYSWWAQAIEYAVDHGANVINMSMGGTDYSQVLHDAVRYAYRAGVPIVAAMMNDGTSTVYYPAGFSETIAVGATDRYDDRWSNSNFGDHIDLVAPGVAIPSTKWDNTYAIWDGTSMATPHVAGVLGLIHAVRPGYSVEELRTVLRATADDQVGPPNEDKKGWDRYFGAGRLNAARAVRYVVPPARITVAGPTTGMLRTGYTFTATVTPLTAAQPITYFWEATDYAALSRTGGWSDTISLSWDIPGPKVITVTAVNFGGQVAATHVITVVAPYRLTVCVSGCDYDNIQAAVDAIADGGTILVASGTYTGINHYGGLAQVVYITRSVTIRGGYTTAFTEPPDPVANVTTIDAQGGGRAIYISGNITPTIEGLHIVGGNAAGLGGGLGGGNAGGGIYVRYASAIVRNNYVAGNTARWGGGVYVWESAAVLSDNVITANSARWGGGVYLESSTASLTDNALLANMAEKDGGGLYLQSSAAHLTGNEVISNTAGEWGGGLYLERSAARLTANLVRANSSAQDGGGLYLRGSTPTLEANILVGNSAQKGGGLYLITSDALLLNNVIADNRAGREGGGVYVLSSSPLLLHSTIARNGDAGLYVTGDVSATSNVTLTNSILVGHRVGITVTGYNTITLGATLWGAGEWANVSEWEGVGTIVIRGPSYRGLPCFAAPGAGDYHLSMASAAVDRGVDTGIFTDIDGDARPIGEAPDLGADECPASLEVVQQASPNPALAGAPLTYTIHLTNTGKVELDVTVTDMLPEHVLPGNPHTWTVRLLPEGGSWSVTLPITVVTGYAGPLTNVVQIAVGGESVLTDTAVLLAIAAERMVTIWPDRGGMLLIGSTDGITTLVEVPPGAVTEPTQLAYTPIPDVSDPPTGLLFAGRAFRLEAYQEGALVRGLLFSLPVTVTLYYRLADVAAVDEATLELLYRSGDGWSSDGIAVVKREPLNRCLVATLRHLSELALFGRERSLEQRYEIYLPLLLRQA